MPVQTHKRPDLRAPVVKLLESLVPAVRDGGEVALASLVEAVAGDKLKPEVRSKLEARGTAVFEKKGDAMRFVNEGPPLKIPLKRFNLEIPPRISGEASLLDGGAKLAFAGAETLRAQKFFFSVRLESVEATDRRVFVDIEGDSFDQILELV